MPSKLTNPISCAADSCECVLGSNKASVVGLSPLVDVMLDDCEPTGSLSLG